MSDLIVAIYVDEGDIATIKVGRTLSDIKPWLFDLTERYWWAGYEPELYPPWDRPDLKPKSLLQVMKFWKEERIMCGTTVVIKRVSIPCPSTVSGYSVQFPEPPEDSLCPFCGIGPCVAMCEAPADDRAYLAAWRGGDFDDELVEHAEGLFAVGYERLLGGVE